MKTINWAPVPDYEGLYEVSDQGGLRRLARVTTRANGALLPLPAMDMRPSTNATGYKFVRLAGNGPTVSRYVHRLVLAAFDRAPKDGEQALHGNDVGDDNRLENLRWGTGSENQHDRTRNTPGIATHCKRGHEWNEETIVPIQNGTARLCRTCKRDYWGKPAITPSAGKWLPIVGHEGIYEVSDQGGVRRLARTVTRVDGAIQPLHAMNLKPRPGASGHLMVALNGNGPTINRFVHRLVLEAFVRKPEDGEHALHYNDIPGDNRLENLRWGTRSENGHDSQRNKPAALAPRCGKGHKFTPANTYTHGKSRRCRQCGLDASRRQRARKAALAASPNNNELRSKHGNRAHRIP